MYTRTLCRLRSSVTSGLFVISSRTDSARVFVGETAKLSDATGATLSVEALFNLNTEAKALNASTGQPGVDAFKDTRVIAKAGLTTTLVNKLSVGFGVTVKYDQNPAALPVPSGQYAGLPYATGVQPFLPNSSSPRSPT